MTAFVYPIAYLPLGMIGNVEKIILLGVLSLILDALAMYCLGLDRKERKLLTAQIRMIYEKYK